MKLRKITSGILLWAVSILLIGSAIAKFAAVQEITDSLTKIGFIPYFPLPALALLEITCVVLFLIPKTWKIGFFLLCGYLGAAGAIEIAGNQPPVAFVLLTLIWIGVFLKDRSLFISDQHLSKSAT